MSFLPEGLARQLDVQVGARVTGVEETATGVRVSWAPESGPEKIEEASAAIVALPGHEVAKVYPQLDPVRREICEGLDYSSSVHVHLGLRRIPDEPSLVMLTPRQETEGLLGAVYDHHTSGRAPQGKGLLIPFFRSTWLESHWDDDDEKVLDYAVDACQKTFFPGLSQEIEMTHVHRVSPCVVKGTRGHFANMAKFDANTNPHSRVQFAGDYLPLSSTNSSLCSGEVAAERIAHRVGAKTKMLLR
jgi:protoporphyrinogen oxidase